MFELPKEKGTLRAFLLAALMHLLLFASLFYSMRWQTSAPASVEAEIWTELPNFNTVSSLQPPPIIKIEPISEPDIKPALQPELNPPPIVTESPSEADIALEHQKRKQEEIKHQMQLEEAHQKEIQAKEEERKKELAKKWAIQQAHDLQIKEEQLKKQRLLEEQTIKEKKLAQIEEQKKLAEFEQQKKQAQIEEQKKQAAIEQQKRAEEHKKAVALKAKKEADATRQARLATLRGLAKTDNSTGNVLAKGAATSAGSGGPSGGYADKVRQRILPNIIYAGSTDNNPVAIVSITCAPDGRILNRHLTQSSGNTVWDEAVLRAIDASDPMPKDVDGKTPRQFNVRMRPKDAQRN